MQTKLGHFKDTSLVALACLILFMAGQWGQSFIGFETRFALFAQEMFRNGPDWFPTTFGNHYPDYPAFSTFLIYLVANVIGEVNKFSATLPTAISSALIVAIGFHILKYYDRRWAIYSVAITLLTLTFATEARAISLDQMIAAVSITCFYLVWRREIKNISSIPWALWPLLVLGFSIRGPLGIVIPSVGITLFYFINKRWLNLIVYGVCSLTILGLCWFALLAAAENSGGKVFVEDVINMQIGGRIGNGNSPGMLHYFIDSLGNYSLPYPFAIVTFLAIAFQAIRSKGAILNDNKKLLLLFMGSWVFVIMLGLSVPDTKKARYLLTISFPLSALSSYLLLSLDDKLLKWAGNILFSIIYIFPSLLIVALIIANRTLLEDQPNLSLPIYPVLVLLAAIQGIVFACRLLQTPRRWFIRWEIFLVVLAFWVAKIVLLEPAELYIRDSKPFVSALEEQREALPAPLILYKIVPDVFGKVYLANADRDVKPLFMDSIDKISLNNNAYYIVSREDLSEQLALVADEVTLVQKGNMDRDPFYAFYFTVTQP